MNMEKYLPIGTVVMLKGGQKRVMITGFCCVSDNDQTKVYDYCGCLYPEGFLSSQKNLLFNHIQIDKVFHMGLKDEEEEQFKERLNKAMEIVENKNEVQDSSINNTNNGGNVSNTSNNVSGGLETLDVSLD